MSQNNNDLEFNFFKELRFVIAMASIFLRFFAGTVEGFFRYRFGERYYTISPLYGTYFALMLGAGLVDINVSVLNKETTSLLILFPNVFIAVAMYHYYVIWWRSFKRAEPTHSYSRGESWGVWKKIFKDDGIFNRALPDFVQRIAEPFFIMCIGSMIAIIDRPLGVFIMIAALCLWGSEQLNYMKKRQMVLDSVDATINAMEQEKDLRPKQTLAKSKPELKSIKKRVNNG